MSNIRVINRYAHTHVKTSDTRFRHKSWKNV